MKQLTLSKRPRRGVAVILVLTLLAVSLSLAYATLRVQATDEQLQDNSMHHADARQAAMSGMAIALRKMHDASWAGVGTSISGSLGHNDSYTVNYTMGDTDLVASDPNYSDYPFRVTLVATGNATDQRTAAVATHKIRLVVKLAPRAIATAHTPWYAVQTYVVTQRANDSFDLHMPVQIRGPVRMQGQLRLNRDYDNWATAGNAYLSDLNALALGGNDYRPFTGPIYWASSRQGSPEKAWIQTVLGIATFNLADNAVASWTDLAPATTYRLYPGGPLYNVKQLPVDVPAGTVYESDPLTNPLGLFYASSSVRLNSNVTIRGTLITAAGQEISVDGRNVNLSPKDLPGLSWSAPPVRSPTIVGGSFRQTDEGEATIAGFVSIDEQFRIDVASQDRAFNLTGKLVTKRFDIREREEWDDIEWGNAAALFNLILIARPLFPVWMELMYNAKRTPKVVIQPDSTAVTYHWLTRDVPFYAVAAGDAGMRWDIVSWKDNP